MSVCFTYRFEYSVTHEFAVLQGTKEYDQCDASVACLGIGEG